jgi:YegS/Rv2252/BmrU family lipid kinase
MAASVFVIFNPAAARGVGGSLLAGVRRRLGDRARFQETTRPGQAEELARAASQDGFATVAAAGGDGTVHEVVNGLMTSKAPNAALGIIPAGSGNDYAANLGVPRDARCLADSLLSKHTRAVDVGRATDDTGRSRFFANALGLGLSGAVAWEVQHIHGLRGLPLYAFGAFKAIWRHFDAVETTLTIDGQRWETPTLFLSVALGRREGGGFVLAPEAELDDGWFDYLHAGRLSRWRALSYLPGLVVGKLPKNDPAVRPGRCRHMTVESATPLTVHADGEILGHTTIRRLAIELLPLRLVVRCAESTAKTKSAGQRLR